MLPFAIRSLSLTKVRRWQPAQVERVQRRRLQRLLKNAVARAPFYERLYRKLDLDRTPLTDLPPTTKSDLMANFDEAVTDSAIHRADLERFVDDPANEGRWFLGRYAVSHTSGSQGQPLLMVCDSRQLELVFGVQMTRGNVRRASPIEALRRFANPARLAVVTLKRGFYPSASAFEYMPPVIARFMKVLRLSQTDPDVIAKLNDFQPTAITAYASVLEMLALAAEQGELRLAPTLIQITNNSEVLTEKARARIEHAFGLHVLNNYATGECPFLTTGCQTDAGAHVNADWAILEVVDADYRAVEPGTPGAKVLITNLRNFVQPIIRYEIGDVVTMAGTPCGCGNRLPRVAHIEGRSADTFWVGDGRGGYKQVINSVFKNAFDYTREVREWQAVQVERNQVVVRLEVLPGATLDERHASWSLDRQLEMYGFRELLDVRLEVVDRLKADAKSGKFRRMVSLVGPPDLSRAGARVRFDAPEAMPAPRMRVPASQNAPRDRE